MCEIFRARCAGARSALTATSQREGYMHLSRSMGSGARLTCEHGSGGRRSRGETAASGHAPRVALDAGGGTEAVSMRLHRQHPRHEDLRGRYGVDERGMGESVAQRAAGELVARSTEDRVRVGLEHAPRWEAPMQHLARRRVGEGWSGGGARAGVQLRNRLG